MQRKIRAGGGAQRQVCADIAVRKIRDGGSGGVNRQGCTTTSGMQRQIRSAGGGGGEICVAVVAQREVCTAAVL